MLTSNLSVAPINMSIEIREELLSNSGEQSVVRLRAPQPDLGRGRACEFSGLLHGCTASSPCSLVCVAQISQFTADDSTMKCMLAIQFWP